MLLDLGRNDAGRVSKIGTVEVTDSFFLEYYSQVMHIVSNIEGEIAGGKTALDALLACFPAGTVSGAPKVRAMDLQHPEMVDGEVKECAEMEAIAEEVERLTGELRDNTLNIRMLPIGSTFGRFRRLVRDLSGELGKEVNLVTEGAETVPMLALQQARREVMRMADIFNDVFGWQLNGSNIFPSLLTGV